MLSFANQVIEILKEVQQYRINTLTNEAKEKNLFPIFMTLTLPNAYHKMKMDKKLIL